MIHQQMESSKEQLLFGIKIFCNIIKVFTATFDEFIAPLVNKVYKKKQNKKNLDPKLLNVVSVFV